MERIIPEETFEQKALKYIADIMKSSRQHKEGQTQEEQVQNEQTQEGQAQKKLTQGEVTALRDLDTCFRTVTSIGADIEKRVITQKVLDIYKKNINNKEIILVCLFVLTNILESIDLKENISEQINLKKINLRKNILEPISLKKDALKLAGLNKETNRKKNILHTVYYTENDLFHNNNPECINDFCMCMISRIGKVALENKILFFIMLGNEELKKCTEIMYNIYLNNPKKEYDEAIINCVEMLSEIVTSNNIVLVPETKKRAFEKISAICDTAIGKKNDTVVDKCSQVLREIATHCGNEKIQKEASKKIGAISSRGFGGNAENSQNVLTRIFARLSRANGSMSAISSQSKSNR